PSESACMDKAFLKSGKGGKNQIEKYLDAAFGGVHEANMIESAIDEDEIGDETSDDKIDGDETDVEASNDKKNKNKTSKGKRKRSNDENNDDNKSNGEGDSKKKKRRKVIKRFEVKKDGNLCNDFQIVYIRGSSDIDE
ncbi:hypothetical protein BGZ49_006730, partial [Haplosporangium sp. Z 27]